MKASKLSFICNSGSTLPGNDTRMPVADMLITRPLRNCSRSGELNRTVVAMLPGT